MENIPVVYCPEMSVQTASYSPSSDKPRQVVADWLIRNFPIKVEPPQAIDVHALEQAHDPRYVHAVLSGDQENGFGNKDLAVAESLRYTVGAMYEAARLALMNTRAACAPVSGFHHAGYAFGGGFCTFNGLMVALCKLRGSGLIKRAAILDLDQHWGNGTHDILAQQKSNWVAHFSESVAPSTAERFLKNLPAVVEKLIDGADILLYQAGADSHVDDPLGGYLTTEQMRRRDRIVFQTCKRLGVPVCWCLAGGYSRDEKGSIEPVLALHRATMQECIKVFASAGG
jgi:acetoin utilization deacetylase AcuC-like enzyme